MSAFTCRLDIPEVEGLATGELTVGREFLLGCSGPWPSFREGAVVKEDPREKTRLKILGLKRVSSDSYEIRATSYAVGQVRFENLVLTDGENRIELGPVEYTVQSVLDPLQPQQEPYGPFGPFLLPVPAWWWGVGLALALALAAAAFRFFRRRSLRRQFLEKVRGMGGGQSPLAELYQRLRQLSRESRAFVGEEVDPPEARRTIAELDRVFRLFLTRRLLIPAEGAGVERVLKELRREHPALFRERGAKIRSLLREFAAAAANSDREREKVQPGVKSKDVTQLMGQMRLLAEDLNDRAGG